MLVGFTFLCFYGLLYSKIPNFVRNGPFVVAEKYYGTAEN